MTHDVNSSERQQYRAGERSAPAATPHTAGFRLGWKETLFRIGVIILLELFSWMFFYSARNDPDLELDRRTAAWCGAILFTGAAVFLLVQLLSTALCGRKALGFIPWLSGSQTSAAASGVHR